MKAGWEVKPLGEVAKTTAGGTPKKSTKAFYEGGTIPWLVSGEVANANITEAKHCITEEGLAGSSAKIYPRDSVLIAMYGATAGEVGILRFEACSNQAVCAVLPNPNYLPEYLYYCLLNLQTKLAGQAIGNAQPNISQAKIKALEIPIPPLEEQKQIVAVLDAAFEGLTRAKENAEANLQNARELFESGFEAQLANSDAETTEHAFGDTDVLEIIDGDRGKAYPKKTDFQSSGYCLFLSTKNVRSDGFKFDDCQFITEKKDLELRKGKLRRRDVILTTRGTIGNIGLFDESVPFDEIRINSGMLILRPNEEMILSDYLFEALRSRVVLEQIEEQTSGAAQPQLPIRTLKELRFSIPKSLTEQAKLVSCIREHQESCAELVANYTTKLTDIADLRQSLLQKAFAGELT